MVPVETSGMGDKAVTLEDPRIKRILARDRHLILEICTRFDLDVDVVAVACFGAYRPDGIFRGDNSSVKIVKVRRVLVGFAMRHAGMLRSRIEAIFNAGRDRIAGQRLDDRRQIAAVVVVGDDPIPSYVDRSGLGRQIDLHCILTAGRRHGADAREDALGHRRLRANLGLDELRGNVRSWCRCSKQSRAEDESGAPQPAGKSLPR